MKKYIKKAVIILSILPLFIACSNDDGSEELITGEGELTLKFEHKFNDEKFELNKFYTNSNGEKIKSNYLKYIVSNITLTKENGETYIVPKKDSYFFVSEENNDGNGVPIMLKNVPAANYTKLKFGIGVDKEQWEQGADGQGNLLTQAESEGMTWSWAAGYKFVRYEGFFTTSNNSEETKFRVHTGKAGDNYNYIEKEFNLNTTAKVRTNNTPIIIVNADIKKILDSKHVINLSEGPDVMGGERMIKLMTENVPTVFTLNKVENQ